MDSETKFTSVSLSDVESQTDSSTLEPISILKKDLLPEPRHDVGMAIILKICSTILILVIGTPIIVSDLYFGFMDNSCVNQAPNGLDISMKLYLLVSGFVSMAVMLVYIVNICTLSNSDDSSNAENMCCVYFTAAIAGVFHLIWNILGAIVFWGTIYGENFCDKNVSTYMFVSLIIKLIANLINAFMQFREKEVKI